jgi:superoxide dismutase
MSRYISCFSTAVQGSGWGWLGYSKASGSLEIATCSNQDPLSTKVSGAACIRPCCGHASHAFAFASYSSLLLFQYSKSNILNWSYAIFAHSTAAWVAQSRVTDHAHNVSDVVIGGIVGATVAASVFFRVEKVQEILQKKNSKLNLEVYPFVYNDDTKKTWYGANVSFHL